MKTVFCDIDGTLVMHHGEGLSAQTSKKAVLLPGAIEKFNEWQSKGYTIILVTGRVSSMRKATEEQLSELGIFWNHLIMDLPNGPRIIINDLKKGVKLSDALKDHDKMTAKCIVIERNLGLEEVTI